MSTQNDDGNGPELKPHVFEAGEPIHADEHGDHAAQIDVTEWCRRCGWHRDHEIHENPNESAVLPSAGKDS